ncbi:structural protein, partial [Helicobacter sp. MIT 00-7814]|uniref:phage capsid family protein n=1 Tax=unclassified Helicobacter TaxID=2593540 RepID=UPI000E1ED2E2
MTNAITYEAIVNNPNIGIEIGKEIEKASWMKSPFEPLVGRGGDRGIRTFNVTNYQPFRPRLKSKLTGKGVAGNADFDTNYDDLEILSQTIYPEVKGNALLSPIEQYSQMQFIDFKNESSENLAEWIADVRDRAFITALSNDFTNIVVADATNGFKDTSAEKSVQSATKKIAKGDVVNCKMLRRAIFMARTGLLYNNKEAFPIKPTRSETTTEGGISIMNYSYLILLDSHGINQLKNDPEWREMQKYAGDRGDKNRLFTGLAGMIDNCPVLDMGVWTKMQPGFLNSEIADSEFEANINKQNFSRLTPPSSYANNQPVALGALIGASALVMGGSDSVKFYIEKVDAGRKIKCAVDRLMAISKGRFSLENGNLSVYSNQDFATIGLA